MLKFFRILGGTIALGIGARAQAREESGDFTYVSGNPTLIAAGNIDYFNAS